MLHDCIVLVICFAMFLHALHAHKHANEEIKPNVKADEPVCYSRFDYDIKILRAMASLEEADAKLTETTSALKNEVQGIKAKIEGK